ncbi:DUF1924 domain-containing protein [Candidatus Sulfurimonas baltica]|uniref:DUF1924 domain-containing protein n=1 Tax=Candidatus Sulfurimonas baltica TaxID=2740404 RepID=A0A7S7LTF0_9BACT|nr:DUF1924 domain-containing protein [Candidatus Sulfurimonas baltica]QOY51038.1 DUF1924 domain-containing protein [Candidatus Sulfurimonas baltica]
MNKVIITLSIVFSLSQATALNTEMQKYMKTLDNEAKKENPSFSGFDYKRGEKIFTSEHIGKNNKLISCVSCHTNELSKQGLNEHTNKVIEPLSPSANAKRFTDVKDVQKWLRRNFKDVYAREGSAQEKGDVITYIISKK